MRKDCVLLLALLHFTTPPTAATTSTSTVTPPVSAASTSPREVSPDSSYLTRPADVKVAVGEPAVFYCGVPAASPQVTLSLYGHHGNYSLTCPGGLVEDIPQALYGSCEVREGQLLAMWTFKGTSFHDNSTRVVCQRPNHPDAPAAVLYVYDDGTSYAVLIGCTIGGFFGVLLVFALSYTMLQRSETLQTWFRGSDAEDDLTTIVSDKSES
ncbi:uncharacterized protein ACBR49_005747 [Aulostomus maculatus]